MDAIALGGLPLLRLLQLASPALPLGAFAYSQGLESAVSLGWVQDERSAAEWIGGSTARALSGVDVPILARTYEAWRADDTAAVRRWSETLHACRESRELLEEERHLGRSMARLLAGLELRAAAEWVEAETAALAPLLALAAVHFEVPLVAAGLAYAYARVESQVTAASRLIPLGQLSSQRVLSRVLGTLPDVVATGLDVEDDDIGTSAPAQSIASALHERQYTRLFRS
ncbi:MAG TPA: urease accessory UreF family protein [Polyangiaceae bacterium]|nr:urease accessory UreF family protein [Polyangiaceae bacterium]